MHDLRCNLFKWFMLFRGIWPDVGLADDFVYQFIILECVVVLNFWVYLTDRLFCYFFHSQMVAHWRIWLIFSPVQYIR